MSGAPRLKFKVQEISEEQGLSASFSLGAERLLKQKVKGARLAGTLCVSLDFSLAGSEVLLRAKVRGSWTLPCSRCLKEASTDLETEIEEAFPASQDSIDVEPALREAVLLEVPLRVVCPDNCGGFQAEWGDKKTGFPDKKSPFDVLKKLKKSDH